MKFRLIMMSTAMVWLCAACSLLGPLPAPGPGPEPEPVPAPLTPPLVILKTDNPDGLADIEAVLTVSNPDPSALSQWSTNQGQDWIDSPGAVLTYPVQIIARSIFPGGESSAWVTNQLRFYQVPAYISDWGSQGRDAGYFEYPAGITVSGGEVLVSDTGNGRIQVFDTQGSALRQWGSTGSGSGQFQNPRGLAIDQGRVYIADHDNHRIQVYSQEGVFLTAWGSQGSLEGQFQKPYGLTCYAGRIYITDMANHRVQVFDTNGTWLRSWGRYGSAEGEFRIPTGIQVNRGLVYVQDFQNNRIQVFDLEGAYQCSLTGITLPRGMSVYHDRIYNIQYGLHSVLVTTLQGVPLGSFGSSGEGAGEFRLPMDLSISDDRVYVADTYNHRIQVFGWQQ